MFNPGYSLIHAENSVRIKFENCLCESNSVREINENGHLPKSVAYYYIISYGTDNSRYNIYGLYIKENFTTLCPLGYFANLKKHCYNDRGTTICDLFSLSCDECPRKTYKLDRGEIKNMTLIHNTCHDCPVGGNCLEGQVRSKPNFWGYESNGRVIFLQCPSKYCCDTNNCKHYNSCHGNRTGSMCGNCPSGMSESLFDTKCRSNKDCKNVLFWPLSFVYLTLCLLFFLYQEDISNFVQKHFNLIKRNGRNSKTGGFIKILFYYYQVVYLLNNTVGSDGKVGLLDDMKNFSSRTLNFLIIAVSVFDCPFKDVRPVQKAIIVHSVGHSLLALLFLLYASFFIFKLFKKLLTRSTQEVVARYETMDQSPKMDENPFVGRMAGAFVNISLLLYASATRLCLSLLHCVPLGNHQVLFLDGNIKCYQTFQYYLLFYIISSILPFFLVPVLGPYLLRLNHISVAQLCLACIFPLPFCCYWVYLFARNFSWRMRRFTDYNTVNNIEIENEDFELCVCKSAVLRILLGPFRQHKATFIFPASHLPWEGFLILRRLALILVVTFVYDNRVKTTLSVIFCAVILLPQAFQDRKR